ncbi:uracil-DNA glycosylase family protein [Devosia oryzisoli]|uniref:uracil-DNA glycosylase family protein n=1 Tax=Devosia oryzisoli TaxID=2774138 RepID=UPI0031F4E7D5
MIEDRLETVLAAARQCTLCQAHLPLGPRPIVQASPSASLLIIGQAPGSKVHRTGVPWNDNSGERLRNWLAIDADRFYDPAQVAIVPVGLCYPGVAASGGDNPPRPECAPLWHPRILPLLGKVRLTILVGAHAQKRVLGRRWAGSLSATVANYRHYLPDYLPLPHPSWRSVVWERNNPQFSQEILPVVRRLVRDALQLGES